MREIRSFSGLDGRQYILTKEEYNWFRETVEHVKSVLGIGLDVFCYDHELLKDSKNKEALGIFRTTDLNRRLDKSETWITIDTMFIKECYDEKFNNRTNLSFENLEHVLCHEFAHVYHIRHTKQHAELTEEFYRKVLTSTK